MAMKAENGKVQLKAKECRRSPADHQKPGRARKDSPARLQREHGPANALISDFQLPVL